MVSSNLERLAIGPSTAIVFSLHGSDAQCTSRRHVGRQHRFSCGYLAAMVGSRLVGLPDGLIPDLLQPIATLRIDEDSTRLGLTLAFAGGTSGGLFTDALDRATVPASSWDAAAFANDLFLQRLAPQYFQLEGRGETTALSARYLLSWLMQPPTDAATVRFRQQILAELLASPDLARTLAGLRQDLGRLRSLLENAGASRIWDANRHRLDILTALKQVFDRLAIGFTAAQSGLKRLADFGQAMVSSEPYTALRDLLSFDGELATLNLKISVGADGNIRGFDVLSIDERSANPFVNPFWRRWLAKIELFLRGYHFSQAEVMARLLDAVFSGLDHELVWLVQLCGDVEFYLGALGFRTRAQAAGLEVCLPELVDVSAPRELRGMFNPLLLFSGTAPVPCDLRMSPAVSTTLITGPNSGGKTRLLQAIGLAQLLAQTGLFTPARFGRISIASGLVASLIGGSGADQTEGRLGMEMLRIRGLFERLPPDAVVLLDELCSGTNPSEGERIVELVLGMLHRLRPQAYITTHFLAFAQRLEQQGNVPGLTFLQVLLSAERRPTYQFGPGVAPSSLASATAERLGVTGDQLLELVEQSLRKRKALPTAGS
jgi:DNA mismatch repair protein MutS2